ncbi:MAG: PAS domain-containing protein, partial [Chitinophagaceae bacterium]
MQQDLHFQKLFESAAGLYLVVLPDLTIVAVSRAYLKSTMTERDKITGRRLFDVFPDNPDDPDATGTTNLRASLEIAIKTGLPHRMDIQKYPIRRPDGSFEVRYWSPLNTPILENNKVTCLIHNVVDVTEIELLKLEDEKRRKEYDDKLILLNNQLKQELKIKSAMIMDIFERITDGFIALDKNFNYTYANKRIGEITHRDPASLIGKNVWEEFPDAVGS